MSDFERLAPKGPIRKAAERTCDLSLDPTWHLRKYAAPECKWAAPIKPLEPWQYGK